MRFTVLKKVAQICLKIFLTEVPWVFFDLQELHPCEKTPSKITTTHCEGYEKQMCKDDTTTLKLVSKELNHLAAILHVYAGGLNFMK